MDEQRFRVLPSCLVIVWLIALGTVQSYVPNRDIQIKLPGIIDIKIKGIINNATMTSKTRSSPCVPAHPPPPSQTGYSAVCNPYFYGDKGECSSIIEERLIYGSLSNQFTKEKAWGMFKTAKAYVLYKDDISARCLQTVELVYCNHYFQRCDQTSSRIHPVQVCREACDIMVQQHCKEEFRRAYEINKVKGQWNFDLINCTTLPRRNGGTIPECYYPKELQGNITREDFSDACSYGDGQSYRGNVSVTRSGYTCQSWTSQCPHRHHRTPENFPELNNAGNACRNPGGQAPHGPWCYTTNASVRWEYCNISICPPEDATLSDWSPFTNCSVSCGSGFKTRYRTCNRSRFGGKECSSFGALTERQPCNVHNCSGNADIVDVASEEKQHKGLTFMEIIIVSAGGSVLLILITTLAVILFKKHRGRKPNIPDKEEITPYATVRISGIFALNAENNRNGLPAMNDNPLQTLPFPPRIPQGERPTGKRELRHSPYENIDHLGRPAANPLEYLFFHPRYENEEVDNDGCADVVMIRPGYDKLTPGTRKKRRENGGTRRLPCGMVDKHGQSVYDSLIREIDLKCKSRRADLTDSDSDEERNIHTILEEPSCDERSPACSMDRGRNGGGNSKQLPSKEDIELGCIGNDWKTCKKQGEVQPLTFKQSNDNLSPRSKAAFKMEDQTGLFEFYSSDPTQEDEQSADD